MQNGEQIKWQLFEAADFWEGGLFLTHPVYALGSYFLRMTDYSFQAAWECGGFQDTGLSMLNPGKPQANLDELVT